MSVTTPPTEKLPDQYDELISIERLVHGEHNPRRVPPTEALRKSIEQQGIDRPLIVRPDPDEELYHITDGWQRYQAATDQGWEHLPVVVYESSLQALEATESASIVREWSTYDWAHYCRALAMEMDTDGKTPHQIACMIADRTARTPPTVRRYLNALWLPSVVHPLLYDGPEGADHEWQALKNHNEAVQRYKGLSWRVAGRLGRRARDEGTPHDRIVSIAANAVQYDRDDALEFIEMATDEPTVPMQTVHRRIQQNGRYTEYLQIPQTTVDLDDAEREAIMSYCAEHRQPLSSLVAAQIQSLASELVE